MGSEHCKGAVVLPGFRELFAEYVARSPSPRMNSLPPYESRDDAGSSHMGSMDLPKECLHAREEASCSATNRSSEVNPSVACKNSPRHTQSPILSSPTLSRTPSVVSAHSNESENGRECSPSQAHSLTSRPSSPRKYACHVCPRAFQRPSSLATHMNTHTGARPHVCPFPGCTRNYGSRSNMQRHYRSAHPEAEYSAALLSPPSAPHAIPF